jgi:hypothetical protein
MADYTSIQELSGYLHASELNEAGDWATLITTASRHIDGHCAFEFGPAGDAATARLFAARDCDLLYTYGSAISSTDGLVIETRTGDTWTTWSADDYQLEPLNQRAHGIDDHPYWAVRAVRSRRFPVSDEAKVRVTAKWGWAGGTPKPVRVACLSMVKAMNLQRQGAGDVVSVNEGMAARVWMVTKDAAALLAPFRVPSPWI